MPSQAKPHVPHQIASSIAPPVSAGSPDVPAAVPPVSAAVSAILAQCSSFIQTLPDSVYARESRAIKGGTIGKHVRHSVDHFAAAIACLDTHAPIDYDRRAREVPMETSPGVAIRAIEALRDRVEHLDERALRGPVQIRVMLAGDGTEATLDSSVGRELHFAFHHAVHHHAMMKAIALEFGVEPHAEFGVAPSTIQFVRSR